MQWQMKAVYLIIKQPLQVVDRYSYFPWSQVTHFHDIVPSYPGNCNLNKATKMLNFVKRTHYTNVILA